MDHRTRENDEEYVQAREERRAQKHDRAAALSSSNKRKENTPPPPQKTARFGVEADGAVVGAPSTSSYNEVGADTNVGEELRSESVSMPCSNDVITGDELDQLVKFGGGNKHSGSPHPRVANPWGIGSK
jgi:hypothetical protein